jgi:alkanesulfonate monooxygenase SsuD/methylene tetrahydromethanopterin reductase-like flavin-dependent oxidoreductase (luciferase family)
VGIILPQIGQQATRTNVVRLAQNAEKEDFDSLWVFERLLWPINPQTPYPGTPDGSLPIESQKVFDPLETLTYVAANTNRIILGTSVIVAFTQIGNNFVYPHGLHFPASFLYMYQV